MKTFAIAWFDNFTCELKCRLYTAETKMEAELRFMSMTKEKFEITYNCKLEGSDSIIEFLTEDEYMESVEVCLNNIFNSQS